MGCCGCGYKASAVTAGIFGLLQGGIGMVLNAFFLNLYNGYEYDMSLDKLDDRLFLVFATREVIGALRIVLVIALLLHILWIISSILLFIGNANNNACMVRQWVVITAFIIIGDFILPVIVVLLTFSSFQDVVNGFGGKINARVSQQDNFGSYVENVVNDKIADVTLDYYKFYIIFLISFIKLGLITIIINICLNCFTNGRAKEIANPRGYVMGALVMIIQNQTINPGMVQVNPNQAGYPGMVQQGVPQQHFPGSIPMQTTANFGQGPSLVTPPPGYDDQGGIFNPIRDELKDPLLSPKTDFQRF